MVRSSSRPSLVRRLILFLLVPLLLIGAGGAYLDFRQARTLTDETFDQVLTSTAMGLAARLETDRDNDLTEHLNTMMSVFSRAAWQRVRFVVQRGDGLILAGDPALLGLAARSAEGLEAPVFEDRSSGDKAWRVATYRYRGPDGSALIVVADEQHRRVQAARHIIESSVWTNVLMLVLVIIAVGLAVGRAIRPLVELGQRVSAHDVHDLRPLRLRGVPNEVLPLVRALNRLVAEVREAAETRQTFLNHAAHQLRTPLAGLQAQVELIVVSSGPHLPPPQWLRVRQSVNRLVGLTQRMLSLARVSEKSDDTDGHERVQLPEVLEEVSNLRLDDALGHDVDLGYEAEPAAVFGVRWMLIELVLNLVDNVLRHCPPGSSATVRCGMRALADASNRVPFIEVVDDGPGIAPEDRPRVLSRFVRLNSASEGSGLGLAIVEQIAKRHAATVNIAEGPQGRGTSVTIFFHSDTGPSEAVR